MIKSPNIKSIAERANVSCATVSLALRNHPRISEKTVRRIQKIAHDMGYRPNPLVVALMAQVRMSGELQAADRSSTAVALGFLNMQPERYPSKISPGFSHYFMGASVRARELGYRLDLFWAKEPGMTARRLSSILLARGICGVVTGPLPHGRGHFSLDWSKFAGCSIGYSMWRPHLHRIVSHHARGITETIRKLQRLNYQRIGLVLSPNFNERVDHQWMGAFLLYQHGINPEQRVPVLLDSSPRMQQFESWFNTHRPEVVLCPHIRARECLDEMKVDVPGEAGFVHLDLDRQTMTFTGIDQRPHTIGAAAIDLLADQLNHNARGIPADPRLCMIEPIWVEGDTTRSLPVKNMKARPRKRGTATRRPAKKAQAR